MAQNNNIVKIDELRTIAGQMENCAEDYQTTFTALIQAAQELNNSCKGDIITTFIGQVEDLQNDFEKMKQAMIEYADTLKQAAEHYETMSNAAIDQVKSLETNLGMK